MIYLPNKDKLLRNFSSCNNWEEKYLYIIELGKNIPPLPKEMRIPKYFIFGCQSQVWISLITIDNKVQFYGDSDAIIVKGLMAILFIFYNGCSLKEILSLNVSSFFNSLELMQHLTPTRSQGLESIIKTIRKRATMLYHHNYNHFTN